MKKAKCEKASYLYNQAYKDDTIIWCINIKRI